MKPLFCLVIIFLHQHGFIHRSSHLFESQYTCETQVKLSYTPLHETEKYHQ